MKTKIAIIGGGNIGLSIAKGLLRPEVSEQFDLVVTRRKLHLIQWLADAGVSLTNDNAQAVKGARFIILCVKPHQVEEVLNDIAPVLDPNQVLISIVAGVQITELRLAVGKGNPIFRAMPNTAAAIGQSMSCLAGGIASQETADEVLALFACLGQAIFIHEDHMEAATVLAATGIAFAFRFIRAATQGGIEIGFDSRIAQMISAQTVKGAATLLQSGDTHPEQEIDKVTTPMGITISGLNEMEHMGFSSALIKGITTSFSKIVKLKTRKRGK